MTTDTKAHLYREAGRWVLSLELEPWLTADLLTELKDSCFVDLEPVLDPNEPNTLTLVQMPLKPVTISCDNCGKEIQLPQVEKPTLWEKVKRHVSLR